MRGRVEDSDGLGANVCHALGPSGVENQRPTGRTCATFGKSTLSWLTTTTVHHRPVESPREVSQLPALMSFECPAAPAGRAG